MTAITFDTLAYSNMLQKAGIPREQAEAITQANAQELQNFAVTQDLATKKDLAETKFELQQQIAETKHEILKWMVMGMLAQTALLVGILAFLK